jgi:hypothetical protein
MKKELIRSLSAINHATSAAITANLSQRQTMTSTTVNKNFFILFYFILNKFYLR